MTTKLSKTIKLILALSSVIIFFIFLFPDYNGFNLYIGLHDSYFSLGLTAVLILAIINYFSINEKYDIATNTSALFIAASFAFKLFEEVFLYYNYSFTDISLGLLFPIMLAPIFMLDRKFNIKTN